LDEIIEAWYKIHAHPQSHSQASANLDLAAREGGWHKMCTNPPLTIAAYQIYAYSNQSGETLEGDIPLLMTEK